MDTDYSGSCFIFLLAIFGACFHEFASMLMIPFSDSKFRIYGPLMKPPFLNSSQLIRLVRSELLEVFKFLKKSGCLLVPSTENSSRKCKRFFMTAEYPANFRFGVKRTHATDIRTSLAYVSGGEEEESPVLN